MADDNAAPVPVKRERKPALPAKVRFSAPYGYWHEDGSLRHWAAGVDIDGPAEIAELVERSAPFAEVKDVGA